MSWFQVALVIHLLGVLLLTAAIALQLAAVLLLRAVHSLDQVMTVGALLRRLPMLFGPATALIVLSGIYMMIRLQTYGWTIVALVIVVAMAALGSRAGQHFGEQLKLQLAANHGQLSPGVRRVINGGSFLKETVNGASLLVALTVIMIAKPTVVVAIIIAIVAVGVGWLISSQLIRRTSRPADHQQPSGAATV